MLGGYECAKTARKRVDEEREKITPMVVGRGDETFNEHKETCDRLESV